MSTTAKTNGFRYGLGVFVQASRIPSVPLRATESGTAPATSGAAAVLPFEEAIRDPKIAAAVDTLPATDNDGYDSWRDLRAARWTVVVPAGTRLEAPIRIDESAAARTLVIVGDRAACTIIRGSRAARAFSSASLDVVVCAGGSADIESVSANGRDAFRRDRIVLAENARANWTDVIAGGRFRRHRLVASLAGTGATFSQRTAAAAEDDDIIDLHADILHDATATTGSAVAKIAIGGRAKAIVRNRIRIDRHAGCTGHERTDALLLSPDAEADVIPTLEIATGEVRCGHAGTISRIDHDRLFYLMSRGLTREDARKQIALGHVSSALAALPAAGRKKAEHALHAIL